MAQPDTSWMVGHNIKQKNYRLAFRMTDMKRNRVLIVNTWAIAIDRQRFEIGMNFA
jgi:hypothetical protein